MRPSRAPLLPSHSRTKAAGSSKSLTPVKLQKAFKVGLGLAGLAPTKTGAGDKQQAYVVRQNSVLRWALALVVLFAVLSVVVLTTMMEVRVVRKVAVKSEVHHHQEEHSAQVKLMQVHISMQRQLEIQLQERDAADAHRVRLMKLVDVELTAVEELLSKGPLTPEATKQLTSKVLPGMRAKIEKEVDASVHKSQKRGAAARASISDVAKQIIADVQLDADEVKRYHDAMAALGTKEDYYADYDLDEDGKLEEAKLEYELEAFFKALEKRPLPNASPKQIEAMGAFIEKAFMTMEDETKESDEDLLLRQFLAIVEGVENVVPYFEAVHDNVLDYMELIVEQAKIAPHMQELIDLHTGWLSGEDPSIRPYTVLANIERLADEQDLMLLLEWMEEHVDEEHLNN